MKLALNLFATLAAMLSSAVLAAPPATDKSRGTLGLYPNVKPSEAEISHSYLVNSSRRPRYADSQLEKRWFDGNNPTEKSAYYLTWLYKDFKSLTKHNYFDNEKFNLDVPEIRDDLKDIVRYKESEKVKDDNVETQLSFARHVLAAMETASEKMNNYSEIPTPEAVDLVDLVGLNIQLLVLSDSHGVPDTKAIKDLKKYLNLYCDFQEIKENMDVQKMDSEMRKEYEIEIGKAESALGKLAKVSLFSPLGPQFCHDTTEDLK